MSLSKQHIVGNAVDAQSSSEEELNWTAFRIAKGVIRRI